MSSKNPLPGDWQKYLKGEFDKEYMANLRVFLKQELKSQVIYPSMKNLFNAFFCTPFSEVKVVIIGQDPYHNPGQAHGLSFSVQKGTPIPPSLANIFKEISNNFSFTTPFPHGELTAWAKQGVFLLNSVLSVRKNHPSSHKEQGWERFTDKTISVLNKEKENLVFLLWGKFALGKKSLISSEKHLVLEASHPSPFSAHYGFLGCQHFSQANDFLASKGLAPIDWKII